ncbi:MAG: IMPACT family protein [Methylosarcina sp.]
MYCVKSRQIIEDTIKKSRFIGVIIPCDSEQDVMRHLYHLHLEHPNATHIAYAYRLKTEQGFVYRFHDAGEPAGTAGKPIFQHLEGRNLINLLVAVIRYYGGVKLGAGGLTRAYGNTAKKAIDAAEISGYVEWAKVSLTLDYSQVQRLEYGLKKWGGRILKQDFAEQVRLLVELPAEHLNALLQSFPAAINLSP